MYKYKVFIENVNCIDTESVHSSDKFLLSGLVATGNKQKGYALPLIRINDGETRSYPADVSLLFEGYSKEPVVGIIINAVDLDRNAGWYENKDNIKELAKEIGKGAVTIFTGNPIAGNESGKYIDTGLQVVDSVVSFFVKNDKDDVLGHVKGEVSFSDLNVGQRTSKSLIQDFKEDNDILDYDDFI